MLRGNRKSTPRVIKGKVQKKNNRSLSPDYFRAPQPRMVVIDRKRPSEGFKHYLAKSDIYRFLELLPDWDDLAVGLNAILLDEGESDLYGLYWPGVVAICAWEVEHCTTLPAYFFEIDRYIIERLNVQYEQIEDDFCCTFEPAQIRAHQLMGVLLHELGHHHDLMTTRSRRQVSRGEQYADTYARKYQETICDQYLKAFPL